MNIRELIDKAIDLAKIGGEVLPPLKGGAAVAEGILDLLDNLKNVAPDPGSGQDLEAAHTALLKRISDKGHALSDRLRG